MCNIKMCVEIHIIAYCYIQDIWERGTKINETFKKNKERVTVILLFWTLLVRQHLSDEFKFIQINE